MKLQIGSRWVGDTCPVFVVAEIGVNHQGDPAVARELINAASDAGVDAVKFQKRSIKAILSQDQLNMPYVTPNSFGATYGEHRHVLELSYHTYYMLKEYAESKGLLFFASAWDVESADMLESLDVPAYKIASADLTNFLLLEHLAHKKKPLLISTGMSTFDEVKRSVEKVRQYTESFALLQCTSSYPARYDELNLRVIPRFREQFKCLVGYSGHEVGTTPSLGAVALGACIIERHLTLDHSMKGSDHAASLEPKELERLVQDIRHLEVALGTTKKSIWPSEVPNRQKLAKSVTSMCMIQRGTVIQRYMLTLKGPGTGISAAQLDEVVDQIALCDITPDHIFTENDIQPNPRVGINTLEKELTLTTTQKNDGCSNDCGV